MTYTVQEAANKMGLSSYPIRDYENQGIRPYVKRDCNNNRVFDETDLQWLHVIIGSKETGMPLQEIKHYLNSVVIGEKPVPERYQIMLKQLLVLSQVSIFKILFDVATSARYPLKLTINHYSWRFEAIKNASQSLGFV